MDINENILSQNEAETIKGGCEEDGASARGTTCRVCGEKLESYMLLRRHLREVHQIIE